MERVFAPLKVFPKRERYALPPQSPRRRDGVVGVANGFPTLLVSPT